jgi:hypothetical protein
MAAENSSEYNTVSTGHNRHYPKQITHNNLKLLNLCLALCVLKSVIPNTCHMVRGFLAEQRIRSALSLSPQSFHNYLNCYEVRKVDGDNDDGTFCCWHCNGEIRDKGPGHSKDHIITAKELRTGQLFPLSLHHGVLVQVASGAP